eukprot:2767438-Prymnesium_polylepis.1
MAHGPCTHRTANGSLCSLGFAPPTTVRSQGSRDCSRQRDGELFGCMRAACGIGRTCSSRLRFRFVPQWICHGRDAEWMWMWMWMVCMCMLWYASAHSTRVCANTRVRVGRCVCAWHVGSAVQLVRRVESPISVASLAVQLFEPRRARLGGVAADVSEDARLVAAVVVVGREGEGRVERVAL